MRAAAGLTGERATRGPRGAWWAAETLHGTAAPQGREGATRGDPEGLVGSGDTLHDTVAHGEEEFDQGGLRGLGGQRRHSA